MPPTLWKSQNNLKQRKPIHLCSLSWTVCREKKKRKTEKNLIFFLHAFLDMLKILFGETYGGETPSEFRGYRYKGI